MAEAQVDEQNRAIEAYEAGDYETAAKLGLVAAWTKFGIKERSVGNIKSAMEWLIRAAMRGEKQAQELVTYVSNSELASELNSEFRALSEADQLEFITKIVHEEVAPPLINDGGGIELVNFIPGELPQIWLHYLGACSGCHLGSTSTADMIINILEKHLDRRIALILL